MHSTERIAATALVLSLGLSLGSCAQVQGGSEGESHPSNVSTGVDERTWEAFRFSGDEVEGYQSLQAMTRRADGVVLGQFVENSSRQLVGDAKQDVVTIAQGRFEVQKVLAGSSPQYLTIEFLARPDAKIPTGINYLVFLRQKEAKGEEGLVRAVNSLGFWAEDGRSLVTPLAESFDAGTRLYAEETQGRQSLVELAALIEEYADSVPH